MKKLPNMKCLNPYLYGVLLLLPVGPSFGQLFENLDKLSDRIRIGVVSPTGIPDQGPKGITAADFDGDGHKDFVVCRIDGQLSFGYGRGDGTFLSQMVVATPAGTARQVVAADFNADGRPDLLTADPLQGMVYVFTNQGAKSWSSPLAIPAWEGARNLAAGDFNGDGKMDFVVAGPDKDITWFPESAPADGLQPRHGLAYYQGTGDGAFTLAGNDVSLAQLATAEIDDVDTFPRPVYTLVPFRPAGQTRDRLAVAHAQSRNIRIMSAPEDGMLQVDQLVQAQGQGIRAMSMAPVFTQNGPADLAVANRDLGLVEIFQAAPDGLSFSAVSAVSFPVPYGPRQLKLADLDADGWNDLICVQRNGSQLVVWKNTSGVMAETSRAATGYSPRELAVEDFNEDGRPDFVVTNRQSRDVSVMLASASVGVPRTGFKALDQVYPSGSDIALLGLNDLDRDGRQDVLQLDRSSGEIIIRMSLAQGQLSAPVYYKMGDRPESMAVSDVNADGVPDLVTTNVGDAQGGLFAARLATAPGVFGPLTTYRPPSQTIPPLVSPSASLPDGVVSVSPFPRLFSVLEVDLDGDGHEDLLTGYYDCRGAIYKGRGDGTFITPAPEEVFTLAYESRFMVHADFDQDGDQDFAVGSWSGQVVAFENTGNIFGQVSSSAPRFIRRDYPVPERYAGARELLVRDVDQDGDPDLMSATGAGVMLLRGIAGAEFQRVDYTMPEGTPAFTPPGLGFPVSTMASADFDGNGSVDIATICADDGCLRISTYDGVWRFTEALIVDCPRTTLLLAGDVDGDGKADLVGTGSVLWVALSSKGAQPASPVENTRAKKPGISSLVINEIITSNENIPVYVPTEAGPAFFGRRTDCIELYNGTAMAIDLTGWSIEYEAGGMVRRSSLPAREIRAGGRRVILCYTNTNPATEWRTSFPLAKEGGVLRLLRPDNSAVDTVSYPALETDTSYARFSDGDVTWRINPLPNPGMVNEDGGAVEPEARLHGLELKNFGPGQPVRFYATAMDDLGVLGMTIRWRLAGTRDVFKKLILFDDGMNADGGMLDGVFSGAFLGTPGAGETIEFYLECEDLSGMLRRMPGPPPDDNEEGTASLLYTLTMPSVQPGVERGLEISEMVASGSTVADPEGRLTNWVEIRNTSTVPLSLAGIELVDSLFDLDSRAEFPVDAVLAPGEHRLVFSRPVAADGVFSGDFSLSAKSEELMLVKRNSLGGQDVIGTFQSGSVPTGMAAARAGAGGPVLLLPPTPGMPNAGLTGLLPALAGAEGSPVFRLVYPTTSGLVPGLEWSARLDDPAAWAPLDSVPGDGLERLYEEPAVQPRRFFRMR